MAKLSPQSRARQASAANAKAASRKNRQAVAMSAIAEVTKEDGHDLSIPFSADYSEATKGNKPALRRFEPTEAQHVEVNRLADAKDFNVVLEKLGRKVATIQWELAILCVALAVKLQRGDKDALILVNEFITKLQPLGKSYTVVRVNAIKAWLLKYAPVQWDQPSDGKAKEFIADGTKKRNAASGFARGFKKYVNVRLEEPYWLVEPERDLAEFSLIEQLEKLQKRVAKMAEMNPKDIAEKYKKGKFDISGLKELNGLIAKLHREHGNIEPANDDDVSELSSDADIDAAEINVDVA